MAVLIALAPPVAGESYAVKADGTTTIGRDVKCDIVLSPRSLSRRHAQISVSRGRFYVEDCGSTNGTFLNGHRLTKETRLQDGDIVNLHDFPVSFSLSELPSRDDDDTTDRLPPPTKAELEDTEHSVPVYSGSPGASLLKGRLDSLIAAARHLGGSLDPRDVPPRVLDLLFNMFPQATLAEVHLLNESDELTRVAEKIGEQTGSTVLKDFLFDADIVKEVFLSGQGVIHGRGQQEQNVLEAFGVSAVCVPILGSTHRGMGVLVMETDDLSHRFCEDDLELVSAVAVLAGQAIGFSRTHQLLLEHEQTQRHLETAREIQLSMVRHTRPMVRGYRFADYYMPALKVGGDYYFYETLTDGRVILGIADASGKGLAAAMAIARFAGEVRLRIATSPTLKKAMSDLNQFVSESGPTSFITCCICLLNPPEHTVTVANAGHPPPCRLRQGSRDVEPLATPEGGLPLGIDRQSICHPVTFTVEPGERILMFTDGATEAMNPQNDLFGPDRLMQSMLHDTPKLDAYVRGIVEDIDNFRNGRTASDDICVVAFERVAG